MLCSRFFLAVLIATGGITCARAQTEIGAARVAPNLVSNLARPLRYRPEHGDFVIENGTEFFNRPLYGGNTAFRADGGDKPEFVLYLPGRGGNLRFGLKTAAGIKWLHDAAHIETRYRPGELVYEIRDPMLGASGVLHLAAVAYAETEGLTVRVQAEGVATGVDFLWAYGGANGQRGKRDGDIGTENVPISQWFQLRPEFCRGNAFELGQTGFTLRSRPATIAGVTPAGATLALADANHWNDAAALFSAAPNQSEPTLPVVVGRIALANGTPWFFALQRIPASADRSAGTQAATDSAKGESTDLEVYREVTAPRTAPVATATGSVAAGAGRGLPAVFSPAELPERFAVAERHFAELRDRVAVNTPDEFINAAVGALNVAADAVWDDAQQAIMHGAIAWRTRLLGWRGPYALDALGWHERFRKNAEYWMGRQNTDPIPTTVPGPDEKANLARNEAGLHTNGDLSNSHYDMNLVFIDALFRHLQWTGDLDFARRAWPVIERHLAWERRLFRREYGPEKLPLYEAYAAIWASDDLQYSGGGAMHASAYNYYHNRQAARLARLIGVDPTPYEREADLLARSMRQLLWVTTADSGAGRDRRAPVDPAGRQSPGARWAPSGWFAESRDWLGLQRVHPSAALWTFYHTVDSEVPTPVEAWQMSRQVDAQIPHLPVRGPGVPAGLYTLGTSAWMPYDWSINNVVMAEAVHGALAMWEAGRADEAWAVMKGSLLAAMYMGISPGNVGSMSYLDVYRRESQRDFADGSGVLSRALVEGLFGVKPDAIAGELRISPGWPADWKHASIRHPDFDVEYVYSGVSDRYLIEQHRRAVAAEKSAAPLALRLRLVARRDAIADVVVNGTPTPYRVVDDSVGAPRIEVTAPAAARFDVSVRWAGKPIQRFEAARDRFLRVKQGRMTWLQPPSVEDTTASAKAGTARESTAADGQIDLHHARFEPVDLTAVFNDRVTQVFRNEYRSPRSPFVSLALPKQGIGGWAGGVNKTAAIDDSGLRAAAGKGGGRITLPNGVPLATPAQPELRNVAFVSQWDNYPRAVTTPLTGRARGVYLLLAGSTNPMQSRFENGDVVVSYADGSTDRLALVNPTNWWPIEQDYFIDDFQFRRPEPLPVRVDLKTGTVRVLEWSTFKGHGGAIPGGAATVLTLPLDARKELKSISVRATANDVVIGLMAATLVQ